MVNGILYTLNEGAAELMTGITFIILVLCAQEVVDRPDHGLQLIMQLNLISCPPRGLVVRVPDW